MRENKRCLKRKKYIYLVWKERNYFRYKDVDRFLFLQPSHYISRWIYFSLVNFAPSVSIISGQSCDFYVLCVTTLSFFPFLFSWFLFFIIVALTFLLNKKRFQSSKMILINKLALTLKKKTLWRTLDKNYLCTLPVVMRGTVICPCYAVSLEHFLININIFCISRLL